MERMGSLDAVFLAIEGPNCPMSVGSVGIFEGPAPALDAVRTFVAAKLPLVPRCRQRAREAPRGLARPVWIDDVHFDLTRHVRHASLPGGEPHGLERFVEDLMELPLDRRLPLWQLWVVDGLPDGGWAVVAKVHHCMVDGIAGTDLLAAIMDTAPDLAQATASPWVPRPEPSDLDLARHSAVAAARSILAHLCRALRSLLEPRRVRHRLADLAAGAKALWLQPSRRGSPLTGPIGASRRWTHTSVSLGEVAAIRRSFGGTVNDAVLAAVAQGFRSLLRTRGEPVEGRTVMALVPVSTRAPSERGLLDNRVAVTHALLPVGIDDPVVTHAAVRAHLDEVKASHQTDASTLLLHTGDVTPHVVAAAVARAVVRAQQNLETIATNVPGPQEPLYLCGRRMLAAYPFAPIAGRIRIALAIWSYCGTLHIGVTGDRTAAGELDPLVRGIDQGFAQLVARATTTA